MKSKEITVAIAVVAFAIVGGVIPLSAQEIPDAVQLIEDSRDHYHADTVSTRSRMQILSRSGSTTERLVDQYSAEIDGLRNTVVIFQSPASVAGTRFLSIQRPGGVEDRWIFLPELGRVRRIAANDGSGSFVGTDMSYDDVAAMNRSVDADTHSVLRAEELNGKMCWLVESVPLDSSYQYGRALTWIEQDTKLGRRMELYDRNDTLVKVMEVLLAEERQGRLTPIQSRMTTVGADTSTTVHVEIVRYDEPIPPSVFTTRFLETGRP